MKKIPTLIILIISSFLTFSCEDVVDVNLNSTTPKLVIDASIKWEKGTEGSTQKIKLTTTSEFFSNSVPVASGATVTVENTTKNTGKTYQFIEIGQSGEYICSDFLPIIEDDYMLKVVYKGQTYTASSKLKATPDAVKVEQKLLPGFGEGDNYQVKVFFQDNPNENNFYLGGIKNSNIAFPEFGVLSDEFTQGNLMFIVYIDELKKGDKIDYTLQGITEKYNNYISKIIATSSANNSGPFAVPQISAIRGNIINTTDSENFPLGYFHLSQINSSSITID